MSLLARHDRFVLAALLALLAIAFAVYAETFRSMVAVWLQSNTYLHGILILPMSAYLLWRDRHLWLPLPFRQSALGLVLLVLSVCAWLLGALVSAQVVTQFALIGMLISIVWTVLGADVVRAVHFPLLFAFFAVPFGEFLVPRLMDWTADVTVFALQLSGIPVLREGNYFSLPSGNFAVIEACSGIRFLIVTLVLGIFFAYETFRTWRKRVIFLAVAAIAVVLANWVRAYLVVLSAHLTDMRIGTGQSHIYMGWVLFLAVITLLFWLGRRYDDANIGAAANRATERRETRDERSDRRIPVALVASLVVAILAAGPIVLSSSQQIGPESPAQPSLPRAANGWSGPEPVSTGYRPAFVGASDYIAGRYEKDGQPVEFFITFYGKQTQSQELVGWKSKLFDDEWRMLGSGRAGVSLPGEGGNLAVGTMLIDRRGQRIKLWYWYDVGGRTTSGQGTAKAVQAWHAITGNRSGDALIVVASPDHGFGTAIDPEPLDTFILDHHAEIKTCLRRTVENPESCAIAVMGARDGAP